MTAWHKWGKLHCLVMSITMNSRFWSHCLQDSHSVSMQNLFMVMFIFIHSSLFCALLSILSPLESPVKLTYVSMCVYDHCAVQLHGDEEEYRTTLLRGASKTIYSLIWQRLSNRLWTREGQQQQWLLFPSTGSVWYQRIINTLVCILTINWTVIKTQEPDWGPSTSGGWCSGCFMSVWCSVPSSMLWCAGAENWQYQITTDSINFDHVTAPNTTGGHSCLWPSNFITLL